MLGALLAKANGQPAHQPQQAAQAAPAPPPAPRGDALKTVNEESNRIISWSLLIIGGSLLAVLDNDYLKVIDGFRWIYFFYLLGWLFLSLSVYWGQRVTRSYLASLFVAKEFIEGTAELTNIHFKRQINWFIAGVIIFALWMVVFLVLWIFNVKAPI